MPSLALKNVWPVRLAPIRHLGQLLVWTVLLATTVLMVLLHRLRALLAVFPLLALQLVPSALPVLIPELHLLSVKYAHLDISAQRVQILQQCVLPAVSPLLVLAHAPLALKANTLTPAPQTVFLVRPEAYRTPAPLMPLTTTTSYSA